MKEITIKLLNPSEFIEDCELNDSKHENHIPIAIYLDGIKVNNLKRFAIDISNTTLWNDISYTLELYAPSPCQSDT